MRKNRFGANLAWLCKTSPRVEVADYAGVNQSTLTNYIHDRITPPMNRLIAIADFFKMTIDDLVYSDLENPGSIAGEPEMEYGITAKWVNLTSDGVEVLRHISLPGLPQTRDTLYMTRCNLIGMEPKINEGDILVFVRADAPINFQVRIVCTSRGIYLGRMKMEDASNFIILSENPAIPTTHLNLSEVTAMYRIMMTYRKEIF